MVSINNQRGGRKDNNIGILLWCSHTGSNVDHRTGRCSDWCNRVHLRHWRGVLSRSDGVVLRMDDLRGNCQLGREQ